MQQLEFSILYAIQNIGKEDVKERQKMKIDLDFSNVHFFDKETQLVIE